MENGPFIDDFPLKTSIYKGYGPFSMAMLNNQTAMNIGNGSVPLNCNTEVTAESPVLTCSSVVEHSHQPNFNPKCFVDQDIKTYYPLVN